MLLVWNRLLGSTIAVRTMPSVKEELPEQDHFVGVAVLDFEFSAHSLAFLLRSRRRVMLPLGTDLEDPRLTFRPRLLGAPCTFPACSSTFAGWRLSISVPGGQ